MRKVIFAINITLDGIPLKLMPHRRAEDKITQAPLAIGIWLE